MGSLFFYTRVSTISFSVFHVGNFLAAHEPEASVYCIFDGKSNRTVNLYVFAHMCRICAVVRTRGNFSGRCSLQKFPLFAYNIFYGYYSNYHNNPNPLESKEYPYPGSHEWQSGFILFTRNVSRFLGRMFFCIHTHTCAAFLPRFLFYLFRARSSTTTTSNPHSTQFGVWNERANQRKI